MTIRNHTLGFPRIGLNRELKKAQENYWAGKISQEELVAVGKELRARHITKVKVLYSKEEPQQIEPDDVHTTASISFVPSVAGLIISGEVIKDICGLGKM